MTDLENQTPPTQSGPEADATLSESDLPPSNSGRRGIPEWIGDYRVIGLLGEGGMGVVWEAEQASPRRRVAVKVMRQGHFVDDVHARMFRREAESLGRLRHPNIATIYESGHTEDGHDFFAMELVRGQTLDRWLASREGPLTPGEITQRLEVFRTIAEAVNYAHQRGVIHRDLKPLNIFMAAPEDGDTALAIPVVKILDFGLARFTADTAEDGTLTQEGMLRGTVAYMSPEQARGDVAAIDVRSDVYSLGVILYEMLAGSRPHDLSGLSVIDAARMVATEPAPRLADAWCGTKRLDRDLETIVAKALELEPDRRYAGAGDLAADLGRFLRAEPILAVPASAAYKARKFVRRHRGLVTASALVAAALVVGVAGTTWGLLNANRERRLAEARAAQLEKVARFQSEQLGGIDVPLMGLRLREDLSRETQAAAERSGLDSEAVKNRLAELERLVAGVDFTGMALHTLQANVLERALKAIHTQFADQPVVRARLLQTAADTAVALGLLKFAAAPQAEALEIRRAQLGDDNPDTLASINAAATLAGDQGRNDEAERLFDEAIAGRRRVLGEDNPTTLDSISGLGTLRYYQGRYKEAESDFRQALEGERRVLGEDDKDTLSSLRSLGYALLGLGRIDEAVADQRQAVAICRRTRGEDDPETITSLNALATALQWQDKWSESERIDREVLAHRRRVLGSDHPDTLATMSALGLDLQREGKLGEARTMLQEALDGQTRVLGGDSQQALQTAGRLGVVLYDQGRYTEAEPFYREVLEARRRLLGPDHPDTIVAINNMGFLLLKMRRYAEAEAAFRDALERSRRVSGEDHTNTLTYRFNLGRALLAAGKPSEAEVELRRAVEGRRRVLGEANAATVQAMSELALALTATGRYSEAEVLLLEAWKAKPSDAVRDRLVKLYSAWAPAEPGRGHDAQAARWRAKVVH
jgi:tetratricopeptide (TPR) repeat protein/tRNA A-37 threonylcarbamoyl transferase component Bud32